MVAAKIPRLIQTEVRACCGGTDAAMVVRSCAIRRPADKEVNARKPKKIPACLCLDVRRFDNLWIIARRGYYVKLLASSRGGIMPEVPPTS